MPITKKIAHGPDELFEALCQIKNSGTSEKIAYVCQSLKAEVCVILDETIKITFEDITFTDKSACRPAPSNVIKAIAKFLWEKCGEKQRFLSECSTSESEAFFIEWQRTEAFKNLFKDITKENRSNDLLMLMNFGLVGRHGMFSQSNPLNKDKISPGKPIHSPRKVLK